MIKDKYGYWFIEGKEDIDSLKCPYCGNKLTFPLTGSLTMEQIEEDSKNCHLIECVDENNMNLGYHIICRGSTMKDLKKLEQTTQTKLLYSHSMIGEKIINIVEKIKILKDKNSSVRTSIISDVGICEVYKGDEIKFKVKTRLGYRNICVILSNNMQVVRLDYCDEQYNKLMTIYESHFREEDPYTINLLNLSHDCDWTPATIIDAIFEIEDIVSKEVCKELKRYDVLEKALNALAFNRGFYVGTKSNGEQESKLILATSSVDELIEQLKEFI